MVIGGCRVDYKQYSLEGQKGLSLISSIEVMQQNLVLIIDLLHLLQQGNDSWEIPTACCRRYCLRKCDLTIFIREQQYLQKVVEALITTFVTI